MGQNASEDLFDLEDSFLREFLPGMHGFLRQALRSFGARHYPG